MNNMANFTNGERKIATERDLKAPWRGERNGKYFRCGLCGHKFIEGDGWRWLYTNDMSIGSGGNPLICDSCYTDKDDTRFKWQLKCEEFKKIKESFWHFIE